MHQRRSFSLRYRQAAGKCESEVISRWRNGKLIYMGSMLREHGTLTL